MLGKRGAFLPFGAVVTEGGELELAAADPGPKRPLLSDVQAMLLRGFRDQRDELHAVALAVDGRLEDSDVIRVDLEHRDGVAIAVLLPYVIKRGLRRHIEYGTLSAVPRDPEVWGIA